MPGASRNPYRNDNAKGEAWELGYLAGYAEPETDHLMPYSEQLLEVYQEGEQAGRDARRQLPPDEGLLEGWEVPEALVEVAEHVGIHALGHVVMEKLFHAAGGLAAVVISVVGVPGHEPLAPLEPDWAGAINQPGDKFFAACPRTDHPMVMEGVRESGYWSGQKRDFYSEAVDDMSAHLRLHSHPETIVVRYSGSDGKCGPVWPGPG